MKKLYIIPIIHADVDMGTQASILKKAYIKKFGLAGWKQHVTSVRHFWKLVGDKIARLHLDPKSLVIYQDGLPMDMNPSEMIEDMVSRGSPNYDLIRSLVDKGAVLQSTEDPSLLKLEYDRIKSGKEISPEENEKLLNQRDKFIGETIVRSLPENKTGLLFIGAKHKVVDYLIESIQVKIIHC